MPVKLLAVYDRSRQACASIPFHVYKLFFFVSWLVAAAPSKETSEVGFFSEEELPELSVSRVTQKQIRRMFEHSRNLDWPTEFD